MIPRCITWGLISVCTAHLAHVAHGQSYLQFNSSEDTQVVRIDVMNGPQPIQEVEAAALDAIFTYCDADGNQQLDRSEAERLPTPFGLRQFYWRKVLPSVRRPDGYRGPWSRADVAHYYRLHGFGGPAISYGKSATSMQLHRALLQRLGMVQQSGLTVKKLTHKLQEMKSLDRDGDRKIGPAELIPHITYPATSASQLIQIQASSEENCPTVHLTEQTGQANEHVRISWADSEPLGLEQGTGKRDHARSICVRFYSTPGSPKAGRVFDGLVQEALPEIGKPLELEERSANVGQLLELIDLNQNRILEQTELQAWRTVHEHIVETLCLLSVVNLYRSLYAWIDTNYDGSLSLIELEQALGTQEALARIQRNGEIFVPHTFAVLVSRERTESMLAGYVAAPTWYDSMDRNRDGVLHRDEFLGSDEAFSNMDGNNDSYITADEALISRSNL